MRFWGWLAALVLVGILSVSGGRASATSLPRPTGEVILTLRGAIANTNEKDAAVFDRAMLEALGSREIVTATPWYTGRVKFEGVPLADLMAAVGATGKTVKVTALNDYATTVPVSDFALHSQILAYKMNGEYMRVRDKGPLFIIYPYDSKPELRSDLYYARSAWQVRTMEIFE